MILVVSANALTLLTKECLFLIELHYNKKKNTYIFTGFNDYYIYYPNYLDQGDFVYEFVVAVVADVLAGFHL